MNAKAAVGIALAGWLGSSAAAQPLSVTVADISPSRSTLDATDPDGASGGRVNGLGVDAATPGTLYAAAEWGGLFKSTDNGQTWTHLDGHVPTATWDVEVDPGNSNRVYATSFYDGRVNGRSGINVSTDGGATWVHPLSATPPAGFCRTQTRRNEPAAFGISVNPDNPNVVYAGTNCGLAMSNNGGVTWTFVDPTPADGANNIWDVVVHDGSIIDTCGDDGHLRSTDDGATWTTAGAQPLPSGRCSLAASPDESYVLFAVVGTSIFESDDGGQSWPVTYANPRAQGRIPFVAINQRSGPTYDLWFGDVQLHRGTCTTPAVPAPGGVQRCNASVAWAGPFTRLRGAHDDSGDIAFAPQVAVDACPILFSSDGGVFRNTIAASPGCHSPFWEQPLVTPHALWNFDFTGVSRAGVIPEDLYFGNQDNGSFGTVNGGANAPTWNNERCCDGFDVAGDPTRVLNTICCFGGARSTRLFLSSPGMSGPSPEINTYPPGNLRSFQQLDSIVKFGPDAYLIITTLGVFVTTDVTAAPIVWTQLGAANTPFGACAAQVAFAGATPIFFVKSGGCNGDRPGSVWRHQGSASGGAWEQVPAPGPGGVGVYAVDPNDPRRIVASHLGGPDGPRMVLTHDGGTNWNALPALDGVMTGGGVFRYENKSGPTSFTAFDGYPQPTLVAFDPGDPDVVVAAGADAGVFLSLNGGTRWHLVTDPLTPGASGTPHVPRPRYAHFDHDGPGDEMRVYLGTQGRSVWKLTFKKVLDPEIQVPGDLDFGDACLGATTRATLNVCNTSKGDLIVDAITSSQAEFAVSPPSGGFPVAISHDFCFPFDASFAPSVAGARSAVVVISSNDPNYPTLQVTADGVGTEPDVRVTGSTAFGVTSAWSPAREAVAICNTSRCDLSLASASVNCPDFVLIHNPVPATLGAGSCVDLDLEFAPSLPGPHRCNLTIASNAAATPSVTPVLTARTPPFLSLRAGFVDAHGALGAMAGHGSTFNVGFVNPLATHLSAELRLGHSRFDGSAGQTDTQAWTISANLRFTVNPGAPLRIFLNGGFGLYHFQPGTFEGGGNLGLGVVLPAGRRFAFEVAYDYHSAFTSASSLEYSQGQIGLLISF